jgi:hypothetical protein
MMMANAGRKYAPGETVFDVTATADSPTHNMFLMGTTTVDWGDGSRSTTNSAPNAAQNANALLQHTYANPGTYTVRVKGSNYRLAHSNGQGSLDPGPRIVTRIRQLGNVLYSASGMWNWCKRLAAIDEGVALQTITNNNMESMFTYTGDAGAYTLPASFKIPDGVTSLSHSFYNMGIVSVPFLIPEIVTNMHNTFSYDSHLQSLPEDFKFPSGVTMLRTVFRLCASLSVDISNIFPSEWENGGFTCDLSGAFQGCQNITGTVPMWLFDGRNNFTFDANTFANCKKLTNYNEIPASWGGGGAYLTDVEYTEVEYLETVSGVRQCIDTGVAFDPTQDWLIEAESEALTGYRSSICASYMDNDHYGITLEWYTSRIARSYLLYGRWTNIDLQGDSLSGKQKLTLSYSASQKTLTLTAGGKQYTSQFTVGSALDAPNLRIFSDHRSNPESIANPSRLYSLRITKAGTLVRDFSPVVSTEGVPYLRDSITGRFYYNLGSGQFIYG